MVKRKFSRRLIVTLVSIISLSVLIVFFVPVTIVNEDRGGRIQEVPKTIYDLIIEQKTDIEISEQVLCTQIFQPVCGDDGKTYSNECFAQVAGVEIRHTGECLPMEEQKNFFEQIYGD